MKVVSSTVNVRARYNGRNYVVFISRIKNKLEIKLRQHRRGDIMVFERFFCFETENEGIHLLNLLRRVFGQGRIHFKITGSCAFQMGKHVLKLGFDGSHYRIIVIDNDTGNTVYSETYHFKTKSTLPIDWEGYTINDVIKLYDNIMKRYYRAAVT